MKKSFYLPDLGEGLAEAEIRQWYVKTGDTVTIDQPVVSVETAKALVDIPSPYHATIAHCYGDPGTVVATGALLVDFTLHSTAHKHTHTAPHTCDTDNATVVGKLEVSHDIQHRPSLSAPISSTSTTEKSAVAIVPVARQLAQQQRIDWLHITGTGPQGVITLADVMAYMDTHTPPSSQTPSFSPPSHTPALGPIDTRPLSGTQRSMVRHMEAIQRTVVPVTLMDTVTLPDYIPVTDITAHVICALVNAIQVVPDMNGHFDREHLIYHRFSHVHLGMAVDIDHTLYLPVLSAVQRDCTKITTLRRRINTLKEKARAHTFEAADLHPSPTFVLSNFGTITGRYATPLVVPPSVAILGVGRMDATRQLPLSLTIDHRALTGAQAAAFIDVFKKNICIPLVNPK